VLDKTIIEGYRRKNQYPVHAIKWIALYYLFALDQKRQDRGFNSEVQSQSSCGFSQWLGKKYRMRYFKIECFSRTMIELIHHHINLIIGYVLKTATFGKVLSNQTIEYGYTLINQPCKWVSPLCGHQFVLIALDTQGYQPTGSVV
jgi:hypothetical protein